MIVLQKFGFRESKYERPQDAWVCGHLADGKPCDLGPGPDGRCRVTTVCQPRLENGRWQCRRPAPAGGPCQSGPLPEGQCCQALERCVPRPSLRTKRKRSALWATALMIGILAVVMGGKAGRQYMMPGKLSSHHAGLTDCSSCHAGARSGQVDLLHRLVTAVEPRQNSNLCVTCHVMGAEPFAPHTHSVEDLSRLAKLLRRDSMNGSTESLVQRVAFSAPAKLPSAETEISCAACHKEHQGVFGDLKTVSNERCQTCHLFRYGSFANSHPQFSNYPYRRRPRVIFDHQTHMTKYFPDAVKAAIPGQVAPDGCADCHQLGVKQRYMEVKSFDVTCSGCHHKDITGETRVSGTRGIDVITVPGLDVATLGKHGIDIGGWPKKSEAAVTPFMRLLLESNGADVVSAVAGLDLLDLSNATDAELARVATLAWAVKYLFARLETTLPTAAVPPSADVAEMQIGPVQMAALIGGISHDVIVSGSREWFPDLQDDLQRHARGDPTRDFKPPEKTPAAAAKPAHPAVGGGGGNAIGLTKTPGAAPSDAILAPGNGGDDKDSILTPQNKAATPENKDSILAADNKGDILSPSKSSNDSILSTSGGDNSLSSSELSKPDTKTKAAPNKSADKAPAPFDPEIWAEGGGWYRQDFAIRYRPSGHADRFLQTWLDYSGRAYATGLHDQLAPIFDELAPQDAVGRCTKCHSVDSEAGDKIVNWEPFDPNAIKNRFTNYSHKPHIELIGTKTCVKCHVLRQTESQFLKTYEAGDPANYTPNFKRLDKSVCAACHSQQASWESCTLCHGYHVGDVNPIAAAAAAPVSSGQPTASAAGTTVAEVDPEAEARHDYVLAEDVGTKQAWDDFVAKHPSGYYYDMAVQQIAKLTPATPEKPATVTSDNSALATPEKSATVTPGNSATVTPKNAATVTPDNSAPSALSKSASADEGTPTDLAGFYRRGQHRAVLGDYDLAIQDFSEVIRRDPKHAEALNDRCWVRALIDEVQDALKDCNAALQVEPNYPDALDSRGLVNLKLGLFKKAIADYTSALLLDPKRASAQYGRGIAKRRSGNAAGAKTDIDAAKVIQPTIVDEFAGYGIQ